MIVYQGSPTADLSIDEIRDVFEKYQSNLPLDGKRVLVVIPDHTRSGPTGTFFRVICDALKNKASKLDFLIALGTHPPMPEDKIDELLELAPDERSGKYGDVGVFNHHWDDASALKQVGTMPTSDVEQLTDGMLSLEVPVLINKMLFDYDHVIICGPIFPHEVVGFSGGHKYFFPGIAAPQIINFTHWVGALLTNPVVNGTRNTKVRQAIEAAADMVPVERSLFGYVVDGRTVRGVFGGPVRDAWKVATELSDQIHIVYRDQPYKTVLSCAPPMYDDIWTAGKCMYKLEPVVADGGTLIIYAPHIDEISYSHGRVLDEIGYHTRDYFVKQWDRFKDRPWGVVAHSTHVKGVGTYDNGIEKPRVEVVLATRIPESRCRQVNLGYMNPDEVNPDDYANREKDGILMVPKAGEVLYRLRDMSKFV
jgi:nickel-dependent lactate racemase